MKSNFKLNITISIESKKDEAYSSWRESFSKTSNEVLLVDSETATVEELQKIVKANFSDVLSKTQKFVESGNLLDVKPQDDPFTI